MTHALDFIGKYSGYGRIKKALTPGKPKPLPGTPTIDEAQIAINESDRLRKRKGVYANIFAGNAAAPTVGKATLGG